MRYIGYALMIIGGVVAIPFLILWFIGYLLVNNY